MLDFLTSLGSIVHSILLYLSGVSQSPPHLHLLLLAPCLSHTPSIISHILLSHTSSLVGHTPSFTHTFNLTGHSPSLIDHTPSFTHTFNLTSQTPSLIDHTPSFSHTFNLTGHALSLIDHTPSLAPHTDLVFPLKESSSVLHSDRLPFKHPSCKHSLHWLNRNYLTLHITSTVQNWRGLLHTSLLQLRHFSSGFLRGRGLRRGSLRGRGPLLDRLIRDRQQLVHQVRQDSVLVVMAALLGPLLQVRVVGVAKGQISIQ